MVRRAKFPVCVLRKFRKIRADFPKAPGNPALPPFLHLVGCTENAPGVQKWTERQSHLGAVQYSTAPPPVGSTADHEVKLRAATLRLVHALFSFPASGSSMKVATALLGLAWMLHAAVALQICAFNIRSFGDRKLLDQSVSEIIVKILSRYDLVLVQEVRDADLSAVQELGEQLNRASRHSYDYVISESLGRENYKEMYLFLYRTQSFSLVDQYQYPNPDSIFSRPPFIVKFATSDSKNELVLVPLHTPPSEAVAEIDALYDVYLKMIDRWQTDNIMFLGDFNADCSYVGKKDWSSIRLRTSEVFKWLISDDTDTTVGNSDCAYDRIVVSGSKLRKWIVPKSAKVFDFQRAFKLSQEEALAVSDHFPVEVELTSP
ncbi:deoxyribonuclease-1-like 2 isoform X1 [Pseudonaja textilis]|uniref:deoxyribonuclease-1-like 2 isoform X1 n=2 Tax=Pseudonaja textilis TaxID=8673 RepID=UPI000EAAACBC|nr:deoxyribonuclease-1-like 2 isoform X1 [Pseudonaja textilis]